MANDTYLVQLCARRFLSSLTSVNSSIADISPRLINNPIVVIHLCFLWERNDYDLPFPPMGQYSTFPSITGTLDICIYIPNLRTDTEIRKTISVSIRKMRIQSIQSVILFLVILQVSTQSGKANNKKVSNKRVKIQCQPPSKGQHLCYCGQARVPFDRIKGEKCVDGTVVSKQGAQRYAHFSTSILLQSFLLL